MGCNPLQRVTRLLLIREEKQHQQHNDQTANVVRMRSCPFINANVTVAAALEATRGFTHALATVSGLCRHRVVRRAELLLLQIEEPLLHTKLDSNVTVAVDARFALDDVIGFLSTNNAGVSLPSALMIATPVEPPRKKRRRSFQSPIDYFKCPVEALYTRSQVFERYIDVLMESIHLNGPAKLMMQRPFIEVCLISQQERAGVEIETIGPQDLIINAIERLVALPGDRSTIAVCDEHSGKLIAVIDDECLKSVENADKRRATTVGEFIEGLPSISTLHRRATFGQALNALRNHETVFVLDSMDRPISFVQQADIFAAISSFNM